MDSNTAQIPPLSADEKQHLRAKAEAATPGPYCWDIRPLHNSMELVGRGSDTVLRPVRWGFQGASLMMPAPAPNDWVLKPIHEDAVAGKNRQHHFNWHRVPARANADWLAAADPSTILRLLDENAALSAQVAALLSLVGGGTATDAVPAIYELSIRAMRALFKDWGMADASRTLEHLLENYRPAAARAASTHRSSQAPAAEGEEVNNFRIEAITSSLSTFPADYAYRTSSDLGYWVCTARDLVEALKVARSQNEALTQQRDYGRDIINDMKREAELAARRITALEQQASGITIQTLGMAGPCPAGGTPCALTAGHDGPCAASAPSSGVVPDSAEFTSVELTDISNIITWLHAQNRPMGELVRRFYNAATRGQSIKEINALSAPSSKKGTQQQ